MKPVLMRERATGNLVQAMTYDGTPEAARAIESWSKHGPYAMNYFVATQRSRANPDQVVLTQFHDGGLVPAGIVIVRLERRGVASYVGYSGAGIGMHYERVDA
jgi:hypothetical protein